MKTETGGTMEGRKDMTSVLTYHQTNMRRRDSMSKTNAKLEKKPKTIDEFVENKVVEDAMQEATETVLMARRIAYKAERIVGYLESANLREKIKSEPNNQLGPSLIIMHHRIRLLKTEEELDDIVSLYDEIWNKEIEKYSIVNIGRKFTKKGTQKVHHNAK